MKMSGLAKGMIAGALLMSSGVASAAEAWTGARHVTSIYPASTGFVFFLDGPAIGSPECGNRFILPLSIGAGYDAIVASLLTAFTAGYSVTANYDDTTLASCNAVVNRVMVTK